MIFYTHMVEFNEKSIRFHSWNWYLDAWSRSLIVSVDNELASIDPVFGKTKKLTIVFPNGHKITYNEGDKIDTIPLFKYLITGLLPTDQNI